jgi:hypothetical protein
MARGTGSVGTSTLGRLRLTLGSLLGNQAAREGQAVLRELDEYRNWREFTFGAAARGHAEDGAGQPAAGPQGQGGFWRELRAVQQYGGAGAAQDAGQVLARLAEAERECDERLAQGYAALEGGRVAEATREVQALAGVRRATGEALAQARELVEGHRREQRRVWDALASDGAVARAALLAQELAALPEIPQLPRPDVSAFVTPYEQALAMVPEAYRAGETDAVCFEAQAVERQVQAAVAAAPAAEAALTRYLYQAAQGYEAALGREQAARVLALLRDPAAVRDLRARHPNAFDYATQGAQMDAFSTILPLLLMTSLLSDYAPGWQPVPGGMSGAGADAGAGEAGAVAGGESAGLADSGAAINGWVSQFQIPGVADLQALAGGAAPGEAVEDVSPAMEPDALDAGADDLDAGGGDFDAGGIE